jgi:hypothetical protein
MDVSGDTVEITNMNSGLCLTPRMEIPNLIPGEISNKENKAENQKKTVGAVEADYWSVSANIALPSPGLTTRT